MRGLAAALLLLCSVCSASAAPSEAVTTMVANALTADGKSKRFSISDDWRTLSGETAVCARLDIPNGAGGWTPTSDFSMFFLSGGAIVNMVKDNSLFGCVNRSYTPLRLPAETPAAKR